MNCFVCGRDGRAVPAVAVCLHCGAGLGLPHFGEARSFSVAGTRYTCLHLPVGAVAEKAR